MLYSVGILSSFQTLGVSRILYFKFLPSSLYKLTVNLIRFWCFCFASTVESFYKFSKYGRYCFFVCVPFINLCHLASAYCNSYFPQFTDNPISCYRYFLVICVNSQVLISFVLLLKVMQLQIVLTSINGLSSIVLPFHDFIYFFLVAFQLLQSIYCSVLSYFILSFLVFYFFAICVKSSIRFCLNPLML